MTQDGSFTVTLFYPYRELCELVQEDQVLGLFREHFPDALRLIGESDLLRQFFANPSCPLTTVQLSQYHLGDKVLVLGDAAHAMVPFYGQGMNAGFEDVLVLDGLLNQFQDQHLDRVFEAYTNQRIPDAWAICQLAQENYHEMSTEVASPVFRIRQMIGSWLHWAMPTRFIPQYTMVSFTTIPYAQVIRKRNLQNRLIDGIFAVVGLGSLCGAAILMASRLRGIHTH